MRLRIAGGSGAWPAAGQACGGYLIEHDGFRLLVDPGYATLPIVSGWISPESVDAVYVSHGHPDHCADLNPLLRARALSADPPAPLPVYAPPGALDAVLALDRPGMLDEAYQVREIRPGAEFGIGPFQAVTRLLPHWLPNAGLRLSAGGSVLAYTGDSGPASELDELADDADLLIAEATYVDQVPPDSVSYLSSAREAGRLARRVGAPRLVLTHLSPGTDPRAALTAATAECDAEVTIAAPDAVLDLTR